MVNKFYNILPQQFRELEGSEMSALHASTSVIPLPLVVQCRGDFERGRGGGNTHLIVGPIESHPTRGITPALRGADDLERKVRKAVGLLVLIGTPLLRDFLYVGIEQLHPHDPSAAIYYPRTFGPQGARHEGYQW